MALKPAGNNGTSAIVPPAVNATADGSLAGTGDVPKDDFLAALDRSTPAEFRDEAPAPEPEAREVGKPAAEKPASKGKKKDDAAPTGEADKTVEANGKKEPTDAEKAALAAADGADEKPGAAKPTGEATAEKSAAEAAAAAAAPATFDPGERIVLARNGDDETAFTRAQLANMARQYPEIIEKANESLTYSQVFGDLKTVNEQWKPMLDAFKAEPALEKYVGDAIRTYGELGRQDPEFATYMQQAADHYRQEKYGEAPPVRAIDRETNARIAAIEQQNRAVEAQQRDAQLRTYIQNETLALKAADPRLEDPDIWTMVYEGAMAGTQRDNTYTLSRAATDREAYIARMWSQSPLNPANRQDAKPVREPAPVLVGGSGAAPRATRDSADVDMTPQAFRTLDDAVGDWKNVRNKLGFGS